MTAQDIETKEAELTAKHNRKVTAYVFRTPEGDAVLFLKNPSLETKMLAWDEWAKSRAFSAKYLFDACAIVEDSDPRFWSGKEADEALLLGAYMKAEELVEFYIGDVKKKSGKLTK